MMRIFALAALVLVAVAFIIPSAGFAADGTTVSMGSALGVGAELLATAIAAPVAGIIVIWLQAIARRIGVQITDADRARLDGIVQNGVLWAAARANVTLDGKLPLDVRNQIVADAAGYALTYGADTLKRLKAPVGDPAALQDIILPRVAKLLG